MDHTVNRPFNICSDPVLKQLLLNRGIEAVVFDAILSSEEKTLLLESLESFASEWFLTESGEDYTEYRGVSIGAAIHDEVLILFHLLIHFASMIDRLRRGGEKEISFYQSKSCLMPDIILDCLRVLHIPVHTTDDRYPWLSYKEQYDGQARSNFSRVDFCTEKSASSTLRSRLGGLKSALKQTISRAFWKISGKSETCIYFHAQRSLMNFYESFLAEDNGIFSMRLSDYTPLDPRPDRRKRNPLAEILHIINLARKGIIIDSLKCPFYYRWYVPYKMQRAYRHLANRFEKEIPRKNAEHPTLTFEAPTAEFLPFFLKFYVRHLTQFMKLIDYYYEKFTKRKVDLCLQEMCHPFQAQVLRILGVNCHLFPSNHIIHNQYFAPYFFRKSGGFLKPAAFSSIDAERFRRLGFDADNVTFAGFSLLHHWNRRIRPFHRIDSLTGKRILILAPSIIAMHTFRYQVQSEPLYDFFSDVFEILSELKVASVRVRPHPGADVKRNQFGYSDNDILMHLIHRVPPSLIRFKLEYSDSYFHNLETDILDSDIAIGNLTGTLFELLTYGRDYIFYDRTITPHYGSRDWTVFNEGTIKRLETKQALRDYLKNYRTPDLDNLRERLFAFSKKETVSTKDILGLIKSGTC